MTITKISNSYTNVFINCNAPIPDTDLTKQD